MRSIPRIASALALLVPAAAAGDLNVSVESGGVNSVTVAPGTAVNYQVVGELSDLLNEGLAGFVFDLVYSGGALTQASAPTSGDMLHFAKPMGLTNPAGFGGTVVNGDLVQVGGAQNTFNNFFTPDLSGPVVTGVAATSGPAVLVTGTLNAPATPGVYTLSVKNLAANAIRLGQTGANFWAVEEAGNGAVDNLTIHVLGTFNADVAEISVSAGGAQNWSLDAGPAQGGRFYWIFGSLTGTSPGTPLGSVLLPLNFDTYSKFTVLHPSQPPLFNSLSLLDGAGHSKAAFAIPASTTPTIVGVTVHHAYLLGPTIDFASNPLALTFLP